MVLSRFRSCPSGQRLFCVTWWPHIRSSPSNVFVSTISYHTYADDTHIYLAVSPNDFGTLDSLRQSTELIDSWMFHNFLQLNKDKTQVIVLAANEERLKVSAHLYSLSLKCKNQVRILGVILDSDLNFSSHITFHYKIRLLPPKK